MKLVRCKMHYDIKGRDNLFLVPRLDSFDKLSRMRKGIVTRPKVAIRQYFVC